jgi:hypothetical protein
MLSPAARIVLVTMTETLIAAAREGLDLTDPQAVAAALAVQRYGAGAVLAVGEQARTAALLSNPALGPERPIERAAE